MTANEVDLQELQAVAPVSAEETEVGAPMAVGAPDTVPRVSPRRQQAAATEAAKAALLQKKLPTLEVGGPERVTTSDNNAKKTVTTFYYIIRYRPRI